MAVLHRIGVLTSGGDAPGMNAAIRAVVRTAIARDLAVVGIIRGFTGLIAGDFTSLQARSVSNTIQQGGTILKTSRCPEFLTPEGRAKAAAKLAGAAIDALVGIGGGGTFQGLDAIAREHGTRCVGIPGTIDNDVYGTDFTIGFDTAANTALESIDKIRDTAVSHDRIFFIEVMGRNCGALALEVGVSGGAEGILVPEVPPDINRLCRDIDEGRKRGKTSFIIVVAEGAYAGGARAVAETVKSKLGIDYRVSILGHVQRGGSPTSFDRALASRLGKAAVEALVAGESGKMVGMVCGKVNVVPLRETFEKRRPADLDLLKIAEVTAT
jgi:6-phosphofructokinase 1